MKSKNIFVLLVLFCLCASCSHSASKKTDQLPQDQKAWAVYHNETKEEVLLFLKQEQIEIVENNNDHLIGLKLNGIVWMGTFWDMVKIKLDTNGKVKGLSIMRGEPFNEYKFNEIADFLETIYGTKSSHIEGLYDFKGSDSTTVFFTNYRPLIYVEWH